MSESQRVRSVPGARAERPGQIPVRGWWRVARRALKEMSEDHLTLVAGGVAYAWFLALFPGLIAAVLIYGLVTDPAQVQSQVSSALQALPSSARTLVTTQLQHVASGSSGGLGIGLVISIALALWSASAGIAGLMEAITIAYDEETKRNFIVKRALALLLTIAFLVVLAVAFALVAVFPPVISNLSTNIVVQVIAQVVRWLLLVAVAMVSFALAYRVGADRDSPRFRWVSPGAVIATVLWVAASVGFSFYVSSFSSYGATYGSLAGVVVLLIWLWVTALVVLLGAEINAEAEGQTVKDTTRGEPRPMGERGAVKADTPPPSQ